jgi:hypothetical protein
MLANETGGLGPPRSLHAGTHMLTLAQKAGCCNGGTKTGQQEGLAEQKKDDTFRFTILMKSHKRKFYPGLELERMLQMQSCSLVLRLSWGW